MTSTYTPNKNLAEPALGDTSWNTPLNSNFSILDSSLGSTAGFTLSSSDVTLSTSNIQNLRLSFTGTLLTNINVIFPAGVGGSWIVSNFTSGNYSVVLKTASSGAIVTLTQRYGFFTIYSDGTNVYMVDNTMPAGAIQAFGGTTAPFGWLSCDGSSVSTTTYSGLFAAIGYNWGGSGASFNVPDLRGMFLRGTGTNSTGASSGAAGPAVGSYAVDTFASHTHIDSGHSHALLNPYGTTAGAGVYPLLGLNPQTTLATTTASANIQATGGAETKPKNYGVLYCIKT